MEDIAVHTVQELLLAFGQVRVSALHFLVVDLGILGRQRLPRFRGYPRLAPFFVEQVDMLLLPRAPARLLDAAGLRTRVGLHHDAFTPIYRHQPVGVNEAQRVPTDIAVGVDAPPARWGHFGLGGRCVESGLRALFQTPRTKSSSDRYITTKWLSSIAACSIWTPW